MSRYVVDASVAVKWYVPEENSDAAEMLLGGSHELHAPDLILPEFGNIIWKKIGRREITPTNGRQIVEAFLKFPCRGIPPQAYSNQPSKPPTAPCRPYMIVSTWRWRFHSIAKWPRQMKGFITPSAKPRSPNICFGWQICFEGACRFCD